MLIMFVGIYADNSPSYVSTSGKAVQDPAPKISADLAQRSSKRACRKKISPGNASRAGGRRSRSEICLYAFACLERSLKITKESSPECKKYSALPTPIKGANH